MSKSMRAFLLQEMATAPTLEIYQLAFQALQNLSQLSGNSTPPQVLIRPTLTSPFQLPNSGAAPTQPYGQQTEVPQQPMRPGLTSRDPSEADWDNDDELFPWEVRDGE